MGLAAIQKKRFEVRAKNVEEKARISPICEEGGALEGAVLGNQKNSLVTFFDFGLSRDLHDFLKFQHNISEEASG